MQSELKKSFSNYFVVSLLISSALLASIVYSMSFIQKSNIFDSLIAVISMTIVLLSIYYKNKMPIINNLLLLFLSLFFIPFLNGRLFYFLIVLLLVYLNTRMLGFKYRDIKRMFFLFQKKAKRFIFLDITFILILESFLIYIKYR